MEEDIKKKATGLGDTIADITRITRIKKIVDAYNKATNTDCGCAKRQQKLNEMFPYKNSKDEDV